MVKVELCFMLIKGQGPRRVKFGPILNVYQKSIYEYNCLRQNKKTQLQLLNCFIYVAMATFMLSIVKNKGFFSLSEYTIVTQCHKTLISKKYHEV